MVRHVGAHDGGALAVGDAGGRVIEGLVEAVAAASAIGDETSEIPNRLGAVHHRGEPGRIGCNHHIHAQASLQAEPRNPEARILVRALQVEDVVGGFGYTPRHASFAAVPHLAAHHETVALFEEAAGWRIEDERRHQVLEH